MPFSVSRAVSLPGRRWSRQEHARCSCDCRFHRYNDRHLSGLLQYRQSEYRATRGFHEVVNYASVNIPARQHVAAGADHVRTDVVDLRLLSESAP
jgi:hypothetical protein